MCVEVTVSLDYPEGKVATCFVVPTDKVQAFSADLGQAWGTDSTVMVELVAT